MAKDEAQALDWDLQESETMTFTITRFIPRPDLIRNEQPRYGLYTSVPGIPMFYSLLLEVLQDPTRNARYKLDAEKCAQIVPSLWLSVLPW